VADFMGRGVYVCCRVKETSPCMQCLGWHGARTPTLRCARKGELFQISTFACSVNSV